jgi:hypothetical protein
MNYDKKVIQYAVTRILTDQKYKEKNKQWAKEQLQRVLNNTDITTRKELVFAIDNILKYEFGLTNMFHVKH